MRQYLQKNIWPNLRHSRFAFTSIALLAATGLQVVVPLAASAAQVTTRSITLSSSTPSATGVSYQLTFTPITTEQELIVDFCGDTPFPGATCAFATTTVPTTTGLTSSLGTVSAIGSGSPVHTIKVTGLTMTGGSPFTITFGGLLNPSTNTSFYARIMTYATGTASGYVAATSTGGTTTLGSAIDTGGDALSTAAPINVTAKVQETLSFCVYLSSCGDTPSITLGHGTNTTLDTTAVDTQTVNYSLSTNALHGSSVALKGATLTSGANTIAAQGASAATITAGTAAFGVRVSTPGSMTASAPYNGGAGLYAFDVTSGTNVTSTYGQPVATSAGPLNASVTVLTFAATASATTPAGIYTSTDQLIATGTF